MSGTCDHPAEPPLTTEALEAWFNSDPALSQARRDGVDVWALWANLQRPVEERIRRLEMAIQTFRMLQNAGRQ